MSIDGCVCCCYECGDQIEECACSVDVVPVEHECDCGWDSEDDEAEDRAYDSEGLR